MRPLFSKQTNTEDRLSVLLPRTGVRRPPHARQDRRFEGRESPASMFGNCGRGVGGDLGWLGGGLDSRFPASGLVEGPQAAGEAV